MEKVEPSRFHGRVRPARSREPVTYVVKTIAVVVVFVPVMVIVPEDGVAM